MACPRCFLPWLLPWPLVLSRLVCDLGSAAAGSELGGSVDLLEGRKAPQSGDPLKAGTGEEREVVGWLWMSGTVSIVQSSAVLVTRSSADG